jgi:hypothetical protein
MTAWGQGRHRETCGDEANVDGWEIIEHHDKVLIAESGSQVTQLITRRVHEALAEAVRQQESALGDV